MKKLESVIYATCLLYIVAICVGYVCLEIPSSIKIQNAKDQYISALCQSNTALTAKISSQALEIASLADEIEQGYAIAEGLTLKPLGEFEVTHYNIESGTGDGITKSGTKVLEGRTVAVDRSVIPLGSMIYIQGIGFRIAEDIGGGINGNELDLYMDKTTAECYELGRLHDVKVWIIESEESR